MSQFSKKLALVCALGGLSLSLTGCHGSKGLPEFTVPEEFDTSRNYEITFWAKNDTNKTQTEIYKKAIADFEALYPNITVNLNLYTDYGKIYNDVITNISTNTTPNVCITYPDHIATYLTGQNTVVPLDDLFANEKYGLGIEESREYDTLAGFIIFNYEGIPTAGETVFVGGLQVRILRTTRSRIDLARVRKL